MSEFILRAMRPDEHQAVADIVYASIRTWYAGIGKTGRFPGGPTTCLLYPQVYEAMDPGCCVVAQDPDNGRLAASCFYHPRPTHVGLGILNAHPDFFGRGVARLVLQYVCDVADQQRKPVRLVSSAMNLDSFSLYTRAGFTAQAVFHDMTMKVPEGGLSLDCPGLSRVRAATPGDAGAMEELEWDVAHIRRPQDWDFLLANRQGIWHTVVLDRPGGGLDGFLCSIQHSASNMLGPGAMRNQEAAAALILAQLNRFGGRSPVWLVPAVCGQLIGQLYTWRARNCEIHLFQVRGTAQPFNGVVMPTFMPETG
jgi:hypothetical protein